MTVDTAQNPLIEFMLRYGPPAGETGPELFVEEMFGIVPDKNGEGGIDPWQREVLRDYGRGERLISLRACHGPGKTAVIAWCIVHHNTCRFPQKTVATAPTRGQLFDALFAETVMWMGKLPRPIFDLFEIKSDRIELKASKKESFFSARTARRESPEALQGVHAPHVLLVVDEASGVDEAIFEAAVGSMSGHNATTILASNPTKTSGFFFDTQNKLKKRGLEDTRSGTWKCYHIGQEDSPRVTQEFADDVAMRYGLDSNAYRVRVLGEFPKADEDTVIPFYLVEAACERDIVADEDEGRVWGLDVARFGDDLSVLLERTAHDTPWAKSFKGLDTMQLVGRVHEEYMALLPSKQPGAIMVDVIGLGAGVYDRMKELDLPAKAINVGESASLNHAYMNLRAELWFAAREWLDEKGCRINPELHELRSDLVVPKYDFISDKRIRVESKDSMKKRGFKSPNWADAFIMTFASTALRAQQGRKSRNRNKAIRRNLPGIV